MQVNPKPLLTSLLTNHGKDVSNSKATPACVHLKNEGHNLIQHGKFSLIEQSTETEKVS